MIVLSSCLLLCVPLTTGNVMDMYKCIAWELGLPTERNHASAHRAISAEVSRLLLEGKQAAPGGDRR